MTRVNCIPVHELTDKHLMAEYREIPRIFKLARPCDDAPTEYKMSAGHVKFFYDKLGYIAKRIGELRIELLGRGYVLSDNYIEYVDNLIMDCDLSLFKDWQPTPEAMEINRARIAERLGK